MPWEIGLIPVAVGILMREGKVLVAQRPDGKPYSGYWEFPGGKIEKNEKGRAALVRELHEELGIDVISAELWFEHHHHYPDKVVHLEIYLVNEFTGEPCSKERQALRWVSYAEMEQLNLLEGNWAILEKVKSLF